MPFIYPLSNLSIFWNWKTKKKHQVQKDGRRKSTAKPLHHSLPSVSNKHLPENIIWILYFSYCMICQSKYLKGYVRPLPPAPFSSSRLAFGGLVGVQHRICIDFGLVMGPYFERLFGTEAWNFNFSLGSFPGYSFNRFLSRNFDAWAS